MRLSRSFGGERTALVPEMLLAWNHDFGIDDRTVTAAFAGNPDDSFTIDGQDIQRDGATLGLGLRLVMSRGWGASLRYDRVQRSDYQANNFSHRLGMTF